eukprot:1979122-Rhodomonas_salina.1
MSGAETARGGSLAMDNQYDAMIQVQNTAQTPYQPHPHPCAISAQNNLLTVPQRHRVHNDRISRGFVIVPERPMLSAGWRMWSPQEADGDEL